MWERQSTGWIERGLRRVGGSTTRVPAGARDEAGGVSNDGLVASQGFAAGETGRFMSRRTRRSRRAGRG